MMLARIDQAGFPSDENHSHTALAHQRLGLRRSGHLASRQSCCTLSDGTQGASPHKASAAVRRLSRGGHVGRQRSLARPRHVSVITEVACTAIAGSNQKGSFAESLASLQPLYGLFKEHDAGPLRATPSN